MTLTSGPPAVNCNLCVEQELAHSTPLTCEEGMLLFKAFVGIEQKSNVQRKVLPFSHESILVSTKYDQCFDELLVSIVHINIYFVNIDSAHCTL